MRTPHRLAAAGLTLSLALPSLALAKDDQTRAAAFQAVIDCRGVADSAARLVCYDAAAAKMTEAETKGDIVVIDRAQARAAHREVFGLHVPSLTFVTRALQPEEVDQIEGVVDAVHADTFGQWTFKLRGGAVWRQIDGDLYREPKAGSKVVIHKGLLGSFKMNVDGQPSIKVHRDE